jgi:hypothetical protein
MYSEDEGGMASRAPAHGSEGRGFDLRCADKCFIGALLELESLD